MSIKRLVVYDSLYGNTEKIAKVIGKSLQKASVKNISDIEPEDLNSYGLVVFGSPTHGGQASEKMRKFIQKIPRKGLVGVKVAIFDTRIDSREVNFFLKMLTKTIGFAASKMESSLKLRGGIVVGTRGFIVNGKEGPLKSGELEMASSWAKELEKLL